jgi:GNAT superfamily N-acetyltransferase
VIRAPGERSQSGLGKALALGDSIDRPKPSEFAELIRIERAAAELFSAEDLPPSLLEAGLSRRFFEETFSAGRLWVVRAGGQPVGFAAAVLLDGSAHLQELNVLPKHGRRGLGRALVHQVAQWAISEGFASLSLTTFRHVAWNAPFYASLGFVPIAYEDQGSEMRETLAEEAEEGFDPAKRVGMRWVFGAKEEEAVRTNS